MKTYITEKDGCSGPDIEACDHSHAEQIAEGLGVRVLGELVMRIESETMTEKNADDISRQFAESISF